MHAFYEVARSSGVDYGQCEKLGKRIVRSQKFEERRKDVFEVMKLRSEVIWDKNHSAKSPAPHPGVSAPGALANLPAAPQHSRQRAPRRTPDAPAPSPALAQGPGPGPAPTGAPAATTAGPALAPAPAAAALAPTAGSMAAAAATAARPCPTADATSETGLTLTPAAAWACLA